jgi:two-component system, response regulator PdtaR
VKPRERIRHQPVILLVEDEPYLRSAEAEVLHEAEFWGLEAQDADEAFEILKRRENVRVVLTDVAMPGSLNGFEFARLVAQGWPEVGVLVISGKAPPKAGDLPPNAVFVPKPLNSKTLVEKVRSVITAR